jgi:transposase
MTQATLEYFGIAHSQAECDRLMALAELKLKELKAKLKPIETPKIEELSEVKRVTEGFHDVFGHLYEQLDLKDLLPPLRYEQLKHIVIARIANPMSKLHTAKLLKRSFDKPLSEDQIYYVMDHIMKCDSAIRKKVFEKTLQMRGQSKINLLLFDVTTLYFESQKADDLRDFGYSKDHKVGETQVVLALGTTTEGAPIGYTLFSRKTAETSTLIACLQEWKKEVAIENVMVVADRAMMSEGNLSQMDTEKYMYVVAAKLKQLPKELKEKILKRKEETQIEINGEQLHIQEHTYQGRRLIISHSKSWATKDEIDRKRLIEKLRKKAPKQEVNPSKLITNRGYLKFMDEHGVGKMVLNEKKIKEESRWDGLHGVITSDKEAPAAEVLARYRNLWCIEESFRLNKHTLAMRPIYHHKKERIQAHVLICYLAFALSRFAQMHLKAYGHPMSLERIREELSEVETSVLTDGNKEYKLPSKLTKEGALIYRAIGIARSQRLVKV